MNRKTAIYTRISTDDQSHESQLHSLMAYCETRGLAEPGVFSDTVSGAKASRDGLEALMKAVRGGKVKVVLCYKLDRLGRSLAHLAQLIAEFQAHGVSLVCPEQGIDTTDSNPAGRLQLSVLAAVAEFERGLIVERVNAGIKAAKARGVRFGRPATLRSQRPAVQRLRDQGLSIRQIASELSLSPAGVHKVLKQAGSVAQPHQ